MSKVMFTFEIYHLYKIRMSRLDPPKYLNILEVIFGCSLHMFDVVHVTVLAFVHHKVDWSEDDFKRLKK